MSQTNFRRIVIDGLIFLFAMAAQALAQGGYAGAVLRMGVGARSEAMGRAYTAVVGNPESAFYNPASVTQTDKRVLDVSYRPLSLDRSFGYVGFAAVIRPKTGDKEIDSEQAMTGGLAMSWIHAGVSDIDGRNFDGEKYTTFSNNQNIVNLSFALLVHDMLSIGISGFVYWNQFPKLGSNNENITASSVGMNFGVLLTPMQGIWLGAVYKNSGGKFTWNTDKLYTRGSQRVDHFPESWRIGVATNRLLPRLLLSADVEGSRKQETKFYLGANYRLMPQIRVRAGLRDGNPTLGAGYDFAVAKVQSTLYYAFVTQPGEIASEHIFAWSFRF